jgi:hypothetical protein
MAPEDPVVAGVDGALMFLIVFDMVVKPFS